MQKMRVAFLAVGAFLGICLQLIAAPTTAQTVTLPNEQCGFGPTNTCLIFDDFTVYSLPLLQEYQTGGVYPLTPALQNNQLIAKPGDAVVDIIATSNQGQPAQGTGTLIDDPYDARTGSGVTENADNLLTLMASVTYTGQFEVPSDPVPAFPGDNILQPTTTAVNASTFTNQADIDTLTDYTGTCFTDLTNCLPLWDANVGALSTALGSGDLVFFFNNNETGAGDSLAGQDLLAWMRVCLTNPEDLTEQHCYDLSGATVGGGGGDPAPGDTPFTNPTADYSGPAIGFGDLQCKESDGCLEGQRTDILPTEDDIWAHVHSDVCVVNGSGIVLPGSCTENGLSSTEGKTVNQSLGADEGTFAIFNADLNNKVKSGDFNNWILTVDARASWLNNGGDQLWIGAANVVPVPNTLLLLGLGLGLLGFMGRRQRRSGIR